MLALSTGVSTQKKGSPLPFFVFGSRENGMMWVCRRADTGV